MTPTAKMETKFLLDWARGCAASMAELKGEDLVMTVVEDGSTFTGMADGFARLYPLACKLAAALSECVDILDEDGDEPDIRMLVDEARAAGLLDPVVKP